MRHLGRIVDPSASEQEPEQIDRDVGDSGGSTAATWTNLAQPPSPSVPRVLPAVRSAESGVTSDSVPDAPMSGPNESRPVGSAALPVSRASPPAVVQASGAGVAPTASPPIQRTVQSAAILAALEELSVPQPRNAAPDHAELDSIGTGLLNLGRGGTGKRRDLSHLSPPMIALFSAILGLATVATLIAIAVRLDRTASHTPTVKAKQETVASVVASAQAPPKIQRRQRVKIPGPFRVSEMAKDPTVRIIDGKVGRSPFLKAVQAAGLPKKQSYRILVAFKGLRSLDSCDKDDRFIAAVDRSTRELKAFEFITSPEDIYQLREGTDGLLSGKKLDMHVRQQRVSGGFVLEPSGPERSVVDGGFEPALVDTLSDALSGLLSWQEIKVGSRMRVVTQEVTILGEFSRYATIEAVEVNIFGQEGPQRFYSFESGNIRRLYDANGRAPYEGGWRKPIPDAPVTSPFNLHRMHPILHKIMPHTGIDFGAAAGTPVGASSFGTVSFIGYVGATGNLVKISHPGGIETGYAHLSRFAEGLKVGDPVSRLQVIGYVGSTGRSTGPHLHFSAKRDGKFFDPATLNLDGMRVVSAGERPAFEQDKAKLDALLDAIVLPPPVESATADIPHPASASSSKVQPGAHTDIGATSGTGEEDEDPGPKTAPAAKQATPTAPANAIYLTDQELMKLQRTSGDRNGSK